MGEIDDTNFGAWLLRCNPKTWSLSDFTYARSFTGD